MTFIPNPVLRTLHEQPVEVLEEPPGNCFIEVVSLHAQLLFESEAFDAVTAAKPLVLRYEDGGAPLVRVVSPLGFADQAAGAHLVIAGADCFVPRRAKVVAQVLGGEWFGKAGNAGLLLRVAFRQRHLLHEALESGY